MGMVQVFVEAEGFELRSTRSGRGEEIAEELRAAAAKARAMKPLPRAAG